MTVRSEEKVRVLQRFAQYAAEVVLRLVAFAREVGAMAAVPERVAVGEVLLAGYGGESVEVVTDPVPVMLMGETEKVDVVGEDVFDTPVDSEKDALLLGNDAEEVVLSKGAECL